MKTYKQVLLENPLPVIKTTNDIDDLELWINSLDFKGKTPRGYKVEKDALVNIADHLDRLKQFPILKGDENNINILNLYVSRLDKERVNSKFNKSNNTQPSTISKKYATYIKQDARAYSRFLTEIDNIEIFLATLKGFHKKSLGNLTIKFVKPSDQKSIAKYISKDDILQINLKKVGNTTEGYGSLRYIVLHELGHRYLVKHRQNWDIDSHYWVTTKYSMVDSFTGEEKFAELYAISHWKSKYKQYSQKISEFIKTIK